MTKQDQAAIAASTGPAGPGHNSAQLLQAFFDSCAKFGEIAGAGDSSKVAWFSDIVERSWRGEILPANASQGYEAWSEARKRRRGRMPSRRARKLDSEGRESGFAARVSEVRRMIELGALPLIHDVDGGGLGTFNRALDIVQEEEDLTGEVELMLLTVARRQCDAPEIPLTADQIRLILRSNFGGRTKAEKEEVEEWGTVRNALDRIMKKYPHTSGQDHNAKQAAQHVQIRIEELGGTKKDKKAADKIKSKANKKKKR